MKYSKEFLRKAVEISIENVKNGGGPFGAVITKDDEVIAAVGNSVTVDHDATAHAEINAIRQAGRKLQTHDLSDCILYSSCEPCPMCLSAVYWSGIKHVVFANDKHDAAASGFKDAFIYEQFQLPHSEKSISLVKMDDALALKAFTLWDENDEAILY